MTVDNRLQNLTDSADMKHALDLADSAVPSTTMVDSFPASISAWADGVRSELRFWRKSLWDAVAGRNPELLERTRPSRQLLAPLVQALPTARKCRVLDVGAGPLSISGSQVDGCGAVELVPVDPLASFYQAICRECGITPPIPTKFGFAEDISAQFPENSFDAVFAVNSLDHTINPLGALLEMLIVTKIGGTIYLNHAMNEGETEGYRGFHQWNFAGDRGDFVIWDRIGARKNVTHLFADAAEIVTELAPNRVSVWITKRRSPIEDLVSYHRNRRRLQLEALLTYIAENQLPPPFGGPHVRRRALKTLIRLR